MPRSIALLVDEAGNVDEPVAREVHLQQVSLRTAELEQERAAAAEEAGAVGDDAPKDPGAVVAAVVGRGGLEREGVALEQRQLGRWHVRHDAGHDVGMSFEGTRHGSEQIAAVGLHAVASRAGDGPLVEVGRHDPRAGPVHGQGLRDRPGPGAEIDRRAIRRQALHGATRERLALPARNVDTGIDADLQPAEHNTPGDPGERLSREATPDERVEKLNVPGRAGEELFRLLLCSDEPAGREPCGKRLDLARQRHVRNQIRLGAAASARPCRP